jgi:hypothetical protein
MRGIIERGLQGFALSFVLFLCSVSGTVAQEAPADSSDVGYPILGVDGQVRLRGEADGRTAAVDPDFAVLSRVRVGLKATLYDWIDAYVQIQDARAWGSETNTLTDASADALDMHQGYVVLGSSPSFKALLGRQEMKLGDERLVGAVDWTNTGRSFDGARLMGEAGAFDWTAFWMTIAERDSLLVVGLNPQFNQGINDDGWLIGGFGSTSFGDVIAELTALYDREAITDESFTLNLRLHGRTGVVLYEAAGAYQGGPDRSAWFASGKAGLALGRTTLALQLDALSGNEEVDDGEENAFRTLYATNHKFYGYMDYVLAPGLQLDRAGLIDGVLRGSWKAATDKTLRLDLHRFSTQQERGGRRSLGTELDLIGVWTPADPAHLLAGFGLFVPEGLATELIPAFAGGEDTTWWGFIQLTLSWK